LDLQVKDIEELEAMPAWQVFMADLEEGIQIKTADLIYGTKDDNITDDKLRGAIEALVRFRSWASDAKDDILTESEED